MNNYKRVICIIQARMGSERLPGKVMLPLVGKPMLGHIIERVKACKLVNDIYIATSRSEADDVIESYCKTHGVKVYRGDELDVLSRYYDISMKDEADVIVRITGDCPLVVPEYIDELVDYFIQSGKYDYIDAPSSLGLIRGLNAEVFGRSALSTAYHYGKQKSDREHVTYYIYTNTDKFRIYQYPADEIYKTDNLRLCVDTQEDFALLTAIYNHFYKDNEIINTKSVIEYLKDKPELSNINRHVQQKSVQT